MQAMTLNEAAQDLLNVIDKVNDNHEPLVVTHEHHKPAVIMSLDDFNAWQETVYLTRSSASKCKRLSLVVLWHRADAGY